AFLEISSTFWSCSLVVFWRIYQREAPKRRRAIFGISCCSLRRLGVVLQQFPLNVLKLFAASASIKFLH
ncbi:38755_t:CDS:2, partial [Gigaspora margarita]